MQSVINRAGWVLAGLVSLLALAALAGIVHGGPLDPPGAPASTAGVLRPGTPITSLPFTISQSGNYYLTSNLKMTTSGDGITIGADDVTLDLGGFTIDGAGIGANGVILQEPESTPLQSITVENGNAEHWTAAGFSLRSGIAQGQNLQASHDKDGIVILGGNLTNCVADFDTGTGVTAIWTTVTDCEAQVDGTGFSMDEGTLSHCIADDNATAGISVGRGDVHDCTLDMNDGVGILFTDAATAHDNIIDFSGSDGIRVNAGSTVENNTIDSSGIAGSGNGINASAGDNLIQNNTISSSGGTNGGNGIFIGGNRNRVSHNTSSSNKGPGIEVTGSFNTIDDNSTFENNGVGLFVAGSKNTVVKNSSTGNVSSVNSNNYQIGTGNNPGPIDAANASSNPWSNTQ